MSVVYFSSLTETSDPVSDKSLHLSHLRQAVTDTLFVAPCIRAMGLLSQSQSQLASKYTNTRTSCCAHNPDLALLQIKITNHTVIHTYLFVTDGIVTNICYGRKGLTLVTSNKHTNPCRFIKCDIYPDFVNEHPNLLLLQPADLLQPLLLELIWLEDLDVGDGGPEDAALVVLDVLGQLVIPGIQGIQWIQGVIGIQGIQVICVGMCWIQQCQALVRNLLRFLVSPDQYQYPSMTFWIGLLSLTKLLWVTWFQSQDISIQWPMHVYLRHDNYK